MLSRLLDIEWLLSTLFDASLLTFKPPETAAFFCCPVSGHLRPGFKRKCNGWRPQTTPAGRGRLETVFIAPPWNTTRHDLARSERSGAERYLVPNGQTWCPARNPARSPGWPAAPWDRQRGREATVSESSLRGCWTSGPKPRNAASSGVAGASSRNRQLR
jgi:hypothetical protein